MITSISDIYSKSWTPNKIQDLESCRRMDLNQLHLRFTPLFLDYFMTSLYFSES